MKNEKWYAVMNDRDDDDWGVGSYDGDEAQKMVIRNIDIYPDGYIAIIENDTCIGEIHPEDFNPIYYNAYKIVTAKDWNECRDELQSLARWLDMESEWENADGDTFENVIREMGKKIGIDLV